MATIPLFKTDRLDPISRGESVTLEVCYVDLAGVAIDTDELPQIEIRESAGNGSANPGGIILSLTSAGVQQVTDGLGDPISGRYRFVFSVPLTNNTGVWRDRWVSKIGDSLVDQEFTFQVISGGRASPKNEDVPVKLGEKPKKEFNQDEIKNLNVLLQALKATLNSDGVEERIDPLTGEVSFIPCSIFTDEQLVEFLCISLSEFNARPHFSIFTFAERRVIIQWKHIITEGANIIALAAQVLLEAGREFQVTDNGINFQPPPLSTTMSSQYGMKLTSYNEKLDMIKLNLKPEPMGLGTFRVLAISPAFLRLRHLRAKQIV